MDAFTENLPKIYYQNSQPNVTVSLHRLNVSLVWTIKHMSCSLCCLRLLGNFHRGAPILRAEQSKLCRYRIRRLRRLQQQWNAFFPDRKIMLHLYSNCMHGTGQYSATSLSLSLTTCKVDTYHPVNWSSNIYTCTTT